MKKLIYMVALIALITGCSTKDPNIKSVQSVDIQKYLGSWYEIARYEHFFEKDCKNVIASYELNSDTSIKVTNSCQNINTNEKKVANGKAIKVDDTNSKLKVSFFWPFYGDYWIIMLDENYKFAVVSEPTKKYLWILAREKSLDEKTKEKILTNLEKLNYDLKKLIWTIQE